MVAVTVRISQVSDTHIALRKRGSWKRATKLASPTYWLSGLLNSRFCSAMLIASTVGTRASTPRIVIVGTTNTNGRCVPVFTMIAPR